MTPVVSIRPTAGQFRSLWKPPVRGGLWCRLHPESVVIYYALDGAVEVWTPRISVKSASTGGIRLDRRSDGRRFVTNTALLYLMTAFRQGIPVITRQESGWTQKNEEDSRDFKPFQS